MKHKNKICCIGIAILGVSMLFVSGCVNENDDAKKELVYGTVTDIDGNTYKTITIGTQTWMAENLKTTRYNDGTAIPIVPDDSSWENTHDGAYCWYNSDTSNRNTYGALYNWHAASTSKLGPTGWHVPTLAEWLTLENFLGGIGAAGNKLKEAGTAHWIGPNSNADNSSGFTALPGGSRDYHGPFGGISTQGYWWLASEHDSLSAWSPSMLPVENGLVRGNYSKHSGFSVRCVKDSI